MTKDNLKQKVELYDPHPGFAFAGALLPLPKSMKQAADKLEGQSKTLEETLKILNPLAKELNGQVEVVDEYKFISFEFETEGEGEISFPFAIPGKRRHYYRLLRYK